MKKQSRRRYLHLAVRITGLGSMLFFAACASRPLVEYEADDGVNFGSYRTYAYLATSDELQALSDEERGRYERAPALQQSVVSILNGLGFLEAPLDAADFIVHVDTSMVPTVDVTALGYNIGAYDRWGRRAFWILPHVGSRDGEVPVKGTFFRIEVYDGGSKELVWVGWSVNRIPEAPTTQEIDASVRQVLQKLPPLGRDSIEAGVLGPSSPVEPPESSEIGAAAS